MSLSKCGPIAALRLVWRLLGSWAFVASSSATLTCTETAGHGSVSTPPGGCGNSCESNDWPRLIVGVLGDEHALTIAADLASGRAILKPGLCPQELDRTRYACSYSISTASFDQSARLTAFGVDGGTPVTVDVQLGTFNYCATDITYIEYDPTKQAWSSARYISPCREVR
jgi:hypothetical protein